MRSVARRHHAVLVVVLLLALSPLLPRSEEPTLALAQDAAREREQAQAPAEKEHDLERARRNGGTSPNRLVVVYAPGVGLDHADRVRARQRAGGRLLWAGADLRQDVVRLAGDDAAAVAAALRGSPGVVDVVPDAVVRADLATDDPRLGEAYGLTRIRAPIAWDTA